MTITTTKDFEPSKDLALLPLINRIKKLGFIYRTSTHSFSSGACVSKAGGYYDKDFAEVFQVSYYAGRSSYRYRGASDEEAEKEEQAKLTAMALALMDSGLGVQVQLTTDDNPRYLQVFAYDVTADLEAYKAAQAAAYREAAKVTPNEYMQRVREAEKSLRGKTHEVRNRLAALQAATNTLFTAIETAIDSGNVKLANDKANELEKLMTGSRFGTDVSLDGLTSATSDAKYAQAALQRAEALELKDEVSA